MGQLLRHVFVPPENTIKLDDMKFMVSVFIPKVKECFKAGGFQNTDKGVDFGGCFLVGYNNNLYKIEDDFQIGTTKTNIFAVGCGQNEALGAMYVLNDLNRSPKDKIRKSVKSYEFFK